MEEMIQEEVLVTKKTWLSALKIFAISLACAVFVFFFMIAAFYICSPRVDAKIFNFFGMKKAEEACYVRAYDMSEDNKDLYNLVIFESEQGNFEKELYYLNLLLDNETYAEFCDRLDKSAMNTVTDKSIVAYTCNTNGYLVNQKIKCMYELGFDKGASPTIRNYIKTNLEGENLFDNAFITYVEIVNSDNGLSKEVKQEKLELIYSVVDTYLTDRFNAIKDYLKRDDISEYQRIVAQNALVNIRKADYIIDTVNESAEVEISKEAYETALQEYNNLIKEK